MAAALQYPETAQRSGLPATGSGGYDGVVTLPSGYRTNINGGTYCWGRSRVRRPDTILFGETQLDALGLERLAEQIGDLYLIAEDMNVTLRVSLTLDGQVPSQDTLHRLNEVLEKVQAGWRLG